MRKTNSVDNIKDVPRKTSLGPAKGHFNAGQLSPGSLEHEAFPWEQEGSSEQTTQSSCSPRSSFPWEQDSSTDQSTTRSTDTDWRVVHSKPWR